MRYSFEWHIEKEKQNKRRHRISFVQVTIVFQDPNQITTFDETEHYMNIRIISARKATRAETK